MNFKHIHIGNLIKQKVEEIQIDQDRICKFLSCNETDLQIMYNAKSLDCDIILRWSKLLDYDLFRIYTQHLILFSPQKKRNIVESNQPLKSTLPQFKKNIYTVEIIDFIMERLANGEKTKAQLIEEYNIPKTTLHRWVVKYQKPETELIK
ncbi:hypothetical protein BCF58_1561 [Chryseobacterium defluvii]|uniref:Uncharacterized protein n=2 Tax=Chryseobacterium defluvii TaxID=160396 RepID=A0A495SCT5_9FLAO|nr:hypothetical protein BCF58_1561 [Chryseobacterium defluvii]